MTDKTAKSKPITFTIYRDVKMVGSNIGSGLWFASDSTGRAFFTDGGGVGAACGKNEDSYSFYKVPPQRESTVYISDKDETELNAILRDGIAKAEFVNKTPQDVLAAIDAIADNNNPLQKSTFDVKTVSPLEIFCNSPRLKALEPKGYKHWKPQTVEK